MTAQRPEVVYLSNCRYALCGVNGIGLFDPREEGFDPVALSSACWRGFVSTYRVRRGVLYLDCVGIGLDPESWETGSSAPELFGAKASKDDDRGFAVFEDLEHEVGFTGGLLLGRGFIEELYVHMGFHPAYKFRDVVELRFEDGQLVERLDRSEQMEALRNERGRGEWDGSKSLPEWIDDCFRLDY